MLRQSPIWIKALNELHIQTPCRITATQKNFGTMRCPNGGITDVMVINQPFKTIGDVVSYVA